MSSSPCEKCGAETRRYPCSWCGHCPSDDEAGCSACEDAEERGMLRVLEWLEGKYGRTDARHIASLDARRYFNLETPNP